MNRLVRVMLVVFSFIILSAFINEKTIKINKTSDSEYVITLNFDEEKLKTDSIPSEPIVKDSVTKISEEVVKNEKTEKKEDKIFLNVNTKVQKGKVSYYAKQFHGRRTSSGEIFNMNALTAAHKTLKFGTKVKIINPINGKSVVVKINDRGPFVKTRTFDLSYAAFKTIGNIANGTLNVHYEILN